MQLANYCDAEMIPYTWFYKSDQQYVVSPYFDTEEQARAWFNKVFESVEE
jgi:hypothetical protein